jgi:hypothetical protein
VVDALRRRVHEMHATSISMYKSDLKDEMLETAKLDQHYVEIKAKLQQGNLQQKIEDFELKEDEILMYRGRVYVPDSQELKNILLKEMHNVHYARHPGYQKTIELLGNNIVGQVSRKKWLILLPGVWNVKKSRLSTQTPNWFSTTITHF